MSDYFKGLVDSRGRPIEKQVLTTEVAAPTLTGVRTPHTSYPGDGLNPVRLAQILKEADAGNPVRFLELAETIEERDSHLIGVLGTRKRSVAQLEITVEAASDDRLHEEQAEMIRTWLMRDELADELFDMLDAIGKGYSFTEIIWDTSAGQYMPSRLEYRDPRWFDFERHNLSAPLMIDAGGQRQPLDGGKFIYTVMKAKSGLPLRGGLTRNLAWAWMFKAFSNRDWAIFSQNYGQPIRVGKYGQGATADDKAALFRAIANIGGDMAAMIPNSMQIEFIKDNSVSASSDLYEKRIAFLDQQVSKAVLGQTATTDAIAGGHAVGKEHRQVQADIERSDAKQLSAVINRDLVRVWIDLNYGPQQAYPRVRIGRQETKDVKMITEAAQALGLPLKTKEAYALIGMSEPQAGDQVVTPRGASAPAAAGGKAATPAVNDNEDPEADPAPEEMDADPAAEAAQSEGTDPGMVEADKIIAATNGLGADAIQLGSSAEELLLALIGDMVMDPAIKDLEDLRTRLLGMAPDLSTRAMALAMRQAIAVAELSGRGELVDGRLTR
jgi:phage gp29-like protein